MNKPKSILSQNHLIDGKYTVQFFLKKGSYAESYRVFNQERELLFLKLFDLAKLDRSQFTEQGDILEIEVLKSLNHPNLVKYRDSGEISLDSRKYAYLVLDFISGETLADKLAREKTINPFEAKDMVLSVLNGVNYLHNKGIIHNELTNLNVMLDLSGNIPIPKIIDFGYARYTHQSHRDFLKDGLSPFYLANEVFNGIFSPQSDIFSVGVLYYHLLEGLPPHLINISSYKSDKIDIEESVMSEREKRLKFSSITDEFTKNIILKALQTKPEHRFSSTKYFITTLNREKQLEVSPDFQEQSKPIKPKLKEGEDFAAIAGMQSLKDTIQVDIIDALNEKEKYASYGLTIPNGMLLYGPPGCGKTFFAEKMAEEIGFNFYQIKPSDIQSKWVNASQENVKALFDEAREHAPSIIFIDELDALVPSRDTSGINHMNTSVVNEFLAQMNNCGDDGVFVIGATNRPDAIDTAVLRSGRLDKHTYLPPPDFETRKEMFRLYLENRPIEIGIDYKKLAVLTENFVSSDIKLLTDEAARYALKNDERITNNILQKIIKQNGPSISIDEIQSYLEIKNKIEGRNSTSSNQNKPLGFRP